ERLALVDTRGNVDGYVSFQADGEGVSMLVYHRTAFAFAGSLVFSGDVRYRDDAYPCSLSARAGGRVLSVKSGFAVSALDDALFSPSTDEALRLSNAMLVAPRPGRAAGFRAVLVIDDPAAASFAAKVEKDWYKSRWVPYWRPLDRSRAPRAPTGWLSWNTYFDQAGSKENLDEARFAAKWLKPFGLEFWNVESWQDNSPKLPVSNFHNMNLETYAAQFPEGMKWLADEIRKLGFRPGLWMAPFGTGNEAFYRAHRDWFLHDAGGRPISCWNGRFTLDPTVPAAREHLKRIFSVASREWGYEFFKIDGMSGRGPGYCAHLYERPEIRARFADPACPNPFELCVRAFREGIGDDRVFLACQGHFTGAEAAYADASRTGADIVHPNEPVGWENILLQSRCTVNQFFAHANVFWSDPDCMLVSQDALGREQAQVEATVVALPGQQTFAGDKLAALAPDRVRLIQQALPACPTRPGCLCPQFGRLPVWDLHVARPFGDWHVVALFNWDDAAKGVSVAWEEIGERADRAFVVWEFWTGTYLGERKGALSAAVPPRGVRLFALQPRADRPQFLTSDRHLTQGAVELRDVRWRDGFEADVAVVGGFDQTLRFTLPAGWSPTRVEMNVPGRTSWRTESDGRILAVTLAPRESGAA
ncbi:MAG: alpha-galactosidase, partial [Kiritimatiellae bacterium]|nr:alpha-galactosidase [Kiritimatiellia bacterium]